MLTVTIPGMRLVSEANAHEHWRKRHARARHQHFVTGTILRLRPKPTGGIDWEAFEGPLVVTITRLAPRALDSDNAVGSAKHVRDAVAKWLGRDDGPTGGVEWRCDQRKSKAYGVEIRIETAEQARGARREGGANG